MFATVFQLLLLAQTAPAAQDKVPLQVRFDRATEAGYSGDCEAALKDFAVIEADKAAMRSKMVSSAVAVRKGLCLIATGQTDEGEAEVRRGMPGLAARGPEFDNDMFRAHLSLGRVAISRLDYPGAEAELEKALALSTGSARIPVLSSLAQIRLFDGDGRAVAHGAEARALALADKSFDKAALAAVQTIYARALLNAGRVAEAYAELKDSLKKQGGLDMTVSIADLATRSDLAITAILNKDESAARRYLSYTGAGRLRNSPFEDAVWLQPPVCNEAIGLRPDDFAIVEFALSTDGRVLNPRPIYARGDRAVALAFAEAVSQWSWKPEVVAKMQPLFRHVTRVELRCVEAGERPDVAGPLEAAVAEWVASHGRGAAPWAGLTDAKAAPIARAALAEAEAKQDRLGVLVAGFALGHNFVVGQDERRAFLTQALEAARALDAPISVRTLIEMTRLAADSRTARGYREKLRGLLADPAVDADVVTGATLRLSLARPAWRTGMPDDGVQLLDWVIGQPALAAQHPLKVNAMLAKANVLARKGDLEGARALFERTGLTAEQCAFLGVRPALRSTGVNEGDYPAAAQAMGFEGWVRTEFNIAADGKTIAPRVIAAYPPFVFNEAGTDVVKGARYTSSYRPQGEVACRAQQESVRFMRP